MFLNTIDNMYAISLCLQPMYVWGGKENFLSALPLIEELQLYPVLALVLMQR